MKKSTLISIIWSLCMVLVIGCDEAPSPSADSGTDGDADADSDADADGDLDADDAEVQVDADDAGLEDGDVSDGDVTDSAAADGDAIDTDADVIDLETYLRENDIARMELREDGREVGIGVTDEHGVVRFYSETHEGVFDINLEDIEETPGEGLEVMVVVGSDSAAYLVHDNEERFEPMLFTSGIPETDAELTVDGMDLLAPEEGFPEYIPEENPFESKLTIMGLQFTMTIQGILASMLTGAVVAAFSRLVNETCRFFAPLHEEVCELLGVVAEVVGGIATGGVQLTGVTAWALGRSVLGPAINTYVCDPLGKVMVGYVRGPRDTSMRDRYRGVAYKYNYLLHLMETSPPADAGALRAELEGLGVELLTTGRIVRNSYFELYNPEGEDDHLRTAANFVLSSTIGALESDRVLRDWILTGLTIEEGYEELLLITDDAIHYEFRQWRYEQTEWSEIEWTEESSAADNLGALLDCVISIVSGAEMEIREGEATRRVTMQLEQIAGISLRVLERRLDLLHEEHWGGGIPEGECDDDEFEPNDTWQLAASAPLPTVLESAGVVYLNDVRLCDPFGSGTLGDDWYAYYVGPMEFRCTARIIEVAEGAGQEQPICLEIYFWSEAFDIMEAPPEHIVGPVCGAVSEELDTVPFSIARTMGEAWSMLLVRVSAGARATESVIDYNLRFTP